MRVIIPTVPQARYRAARLSAVFALASSSRASVKGVDLTGQDKPATLSGSDQETYLLDQLAQAAHACQTAGGRLVLVLDGLDEDRSLTTGPDAHSIAGLLPADPPGGMRARTPGGGPRHGRASPR